MVRSGDERHQHRDGFGCVSQEVASLELQNGRPLPILSPSFELQGPGLERQRKAGGEAAWTDNVLWRSALVGTVAVCSLAHPSVRRLDDLIERRMPWLPAQYGLCSIGACDEAGWIARPARVHHVRQVLAGDTTNGVY